MATTAPQVIRINPRPPIFGTTDDEVNQLEQHVRSTAPYIFSRACQATRVYGTMRATNGILPHVNVCVHSSTAQLLLETMPSRIDESKGYMANNYLAGHFYAVLDWMNGHRVRLLEVRMQRAAQEQEDAATADAAR